MTDQHPIVPSFEMANQWHKEACKDPYNGGKFIESKTLKYIATKAAQWGADQELDACCEWAQGYAECGDSLRLARRPKPPSLREQACDALDTYVYGDPNQDDKVRTYNTIRAALDALPNY
jgi:hypothetical protein